MSDSRQGSLQAKSCLGHAEVVATVPPAWNTWLWQRWLLSRTPLGGTSLYHVLHAGAGSAATVSHAMTATVAVAPTQGTAETGGWGSKTMVVTAGNVAERQLGLRQPSLTLLLLITMSTGPVPWPLPPAMPPCQFLVARR